jgi:hypothetical protein
MEGVATRARIVGWERDRGILVEVGQTGEVSLAQSLVALSELELQRAASEKAAVMVTFEDGDQARPVILGLLAPVPAPPRAAPVAEGFEEFVVVKGRESIELRCGAASITLRKDGRLVLRGTDVVSLATNENRIVGGSVHFN